ncbi:bifunctional phosphopantothenoylcysteine decarboxylase/phosphopantothenate--cysteine ligase CoaBC [Arachidicoccus soli]|uniref:Coenzyme A biosynthesis bifunctional protein CoaBC n=1 Tax=Arachidicoccus soli TaxID=2341117 RepID=A0A386HMW3_9BACT|nr:bifunctional phosphopantothenoylcysteine decarboxylase/phosphopantothenate--cysteine ligase CoaBC [Arachidicoccus soli]AYD47237.1 bifunctional phosphopantothenoylcysteine decarboxylase/phosphopantothenate--cysteine ligase CoaBC [Arachidicoccus soli]
MLVGKKILIGISGSIAAYKTILLTRLLVKEGAEVKVVMTEAATKFVSPLVLSTLSNNKVLIDLFKEDVWANHVMLGRWADLMIIAPLSCNTLAKMAQGFCDNLLLSVYLSATCKVMCAPAMDEEMWLHPVTQQNITTLKKNGNLVLDVANGDLASGLIGEGRMMEPEEILLSIKSFFRKESFKGKKILITSGPTYEAIDPVRFIANHSTGKMGTALAEALYLLGAEVTLISGPTKVLPQFKEINILPVVSAEEMFNTCLEHFSTCDIAILAAAVADYTPIEKANQKIKKTEDEFDLKLKKTKDILKELGKQKQKQILVGFALETNNALTNAQIKLEEKQADFIVLNSMENTGAGFGYDTNNVIVLDKNGDKNESGLVSKEAAAYFIAGIIEKNI